MKLLLASSDLSANENNLKALIHKIGGVNIEMIDRVRDNLVKYEQNSVAEVHVYGVIDYAILRQLHDWLQPGGRVFGVDDMRSDLILAGFIIEGDVKKPEWGVGSTLPLKKSILEEDLDDDDIIDESELLNAPTGNIIQPPECKPGKKRKPCSNCTCGLALGEEELDFTLQGKPSSCGNCSLGDAFRCSSCPYIGMPPFKPGEIVSVDVLGDDL